LPVVVTFGLQQGSRTQVWCYDAAAVSSVGGLTNGPSSGSAIVTVAGTGFGSFGHSGRVRVGRGAASDGDMTGGSGCEMSAWKSTSGVECKLSAGVGGGFPVRRGQGLPVVVTFGLQQGSRTQVWCYDAAAVSSVGGLTNGPSSGSSSVIVFGSRFGGFVVSSAINVAPFSFSNGFVFSSSHASFWICDSALMFKVPSGLGRRISMVVSSQLQLGSLSMSFSYEISKVIPTFTRFVSTGSIFVPLHASGFGLFGLSPRVSLGSSVCSVSLWSSDSVLIAKVSSSRFFATASIIISFLNVQALNSRAFSFEANSMLRSSSSNLSSSTVFSATRMTQTNIPTNSPALIVRNETPVNWPFACANCSLVQINNFPTTASNLLAIVGMNYASADSSLQARFSSSASMSRWFSDSILVAKIAAGRQGGIFTVATVNMQKGIDVISLISFDLFNIIRVQLSSSVPSTGGYGITSIGSHFGLFACSLSVSLQNTISESSVWNSHSSIKSKSAVFISSKPVLSVSVGLNISRFVFGEQIPSLAHSVQDFSPKFRPVTGASLIHFRGSDFGSCNPSIKNDIGASNCERSHWHSGTNLICKLPLGYSPRPEFTVSMMQVQIMFQLLTPIVTLSRPVFLNAKPLQRSVFLTWQNSGPGQPKSVSVFEFVHGAMTISSVALFLQSNRFIVLPSNATSLLYQMTAAAHLYIVFHFDFEISFSAILGKPAPFAAPLQFSGQPSGNLRSIATWRFLEPNDAEFSKWNLRAIDSRNLSNVFLEITSLSVSIFSYIIDVSNRPGINFAKLELVALNDFDQIVTNATTLIEFSLIPQPLTLQNVGSRKDYGIRVGVSWLNKADRLSLEISPTESFASYDTLEIKVEAELRNAQVLIPGERLKFDNFYFIRYLVHYLSLTSLESQVLTVEYHIIPRILFTSPKVLVVSLGEPFVRLTIAMSRPCCISGDAVCALTSSLQVLRIGRVAYAMVLDPNQYGIDYSVSTNIDFIVPAPEVSGLAALEVSCDDGNSSSVIPVTVSNPVRLVSLFPSEVSQDGGSSIRCVLANLVHLPSVMFANISGDVVPLRSVSLEKMTLIAEFICPASAVSGLQSIQLHIGSSKFSLSILRTGQLHVVEVIPTEMTAGIRTPLRLVVEVVRCNQPQLLLNGNVLSGAVVESSELSVSRFLFVFSAYLELSIVGLANATASFRCGLSELSTSAIINVVAAPNPTLFISTTLRDNSLNLVSVVFTTPTHLNLETFFIISTAAHSQLPLIVRSSTTRCAPSCFFSFSINVPLGLSSVQFTLQYSATGLNTTRSISTVASIRSNDEARILRIVPSILDYRGGQVMLVSMSSASVHNFSLSSPAFASPILCKILAVVNMSTSHSRSDAFTQLSQLFANEPRYMDLLVESMGMLEKSNVSASSVAVLMSPSLPFTRRDSSFETLLEFSAQSIISQVFLRMNVSIDVPAADQMQPTIVVQNGGILELSTASFFRASGQYFPPVAFKSNVIISSQTPNAPLFIIDSLSWSNGMIFFACEFLSASTGKFVYLMQFSLSSGQFSVTIDITIVDSTKLPVILSVEPSYIYESSGIQILNISVQNALAVTANAFVERLNCGTVICLPTVLPNVVMARIQVNTTFLAVGNAVISLLFGNYPSYSNIKILKMPLQMQLLRLNPNVLLCTAGGRMLDVEATGVPRIFNTQFLRLSCPLLNPAPSILSATIDEILSLRFFLPPQERCMNLNALCLVSFPDPSCKSSCFFNFSLSIHPDSLSMISGVLPSSGKSLTELMVSVSATNVLTLSQSELRYNCDVPDVTIAGQRARGTFAGPGASSRSIIPVSLYLNRSLSSALVTHCSIKSSETSQIISFPFIFLPSELGSYIQHSPIKWVMGERFVLTILASDGSLFPVLGCIATLLEPNISVNTMIDVSGTARNISGAGWRSASLINVAQRQLTFRLSIDPVNTLGPLKIFVRLLSLSGDQVTEILRVDIVEPAVPVLSLNPRMVTLGSPFQLLVQNMPNITTALKLLVSVKLSTGLEINLMILKNFISRNDMYASLDLICVTPAFELPPSAALTLKVYDLSLPHRVAMTQLNLLRPSDPRIISMSPSIAALNIATFLSVEVDNFSSWESCELEAAFVSDNLRVPTKVVSSAASALEGRSNIKLLSPLLLQAAELKVELQCQASRITSATSLMIINPDRLTVLSYSPVSVPAVSGGILSLLVQASAHVTKFTASMELANSVPKSCNLQVELLPNFLFRIQIFVDPIDTVLAFDTLGFIRIVPDSRSENFVTFQIMFTAVQVSLRSVLPSTVDQGLATLVTAEFLNVPPSVSSYLRITSPHILIELPEIISCNPSRCIYRFVIDLSRRIVRDQIDLSFSFMSMLDNNPMSKTIMVQNPLICDVIEVTPSALVYNRTNSIIIRISNLSIQSLNLQSSSGLQEIVGNRKLNDFGSYFLLSLSVAVSSTRPAWLFISDVSCSSNLTFPIQPREDATIIQIVPNLVSSGQTAVVDMLARCPNKAGVYIPLFGSFQSLSFTSRNLTDSICSVALIMPIFQFSSEIWLNFSHSEYAISASITSISGCSDRISLGEFCSSLGLVRNIFSEDYTLFCQDRACLNPLDLPKQVLLKNPRFISLKPNSVISVSIKWLYASSSSDILVLLDEQVFASFNAVEKMDNVTDIDISVPRMWSPGVHSVVIYSKLIGRVRNSIFNIEGRTVMSPNISFFLPSSTLPYEGLSRSTIGVSSFEGSFNDTTFLELSCDKNIVESFNPVSLSADNLLLLSAIFNPSYSPILGVADAIVSCELRNSKPDNAFAVRFVVKVSKRSTRILYFSPSSVVNGADDSITVEASGVYDTLCLYINNYNVSSSSLVVFEPSVAQSVKVFKISTPLVGNFLSSPAAVAVIVGSCSTPVRVAAEASSKLRVLPPTLPLILGINPSSMAYTASGVTLIGQFFNDIQRVSLSPSSEVIMISWRIVSFFSGNQTEIVVLFKATAPVTVILKAEVNNAELQGSFSLLHSPTIVQPNVLVLPLPPGTKLSLSSSRILATIDFSRVRILFNGELSQTSQCEYRNPNTAVCTAPLRIPPGIVLIALIVNNQLLLNDTTINILPAPSILMGSAATFSLAGGDRQLHITVNSWPCVSFPVITLNETNVLFILTEKKIADNGFFSATIEIPEVAAAGIQKLYVYGIFDGNKVMAEASIQFNLNSPSITLYSGRTFSDGTAGHTERIICRNFPKISQPQDAIVKFGNIFVASRIAFVSDQEALVMLDVVVPVQPPQIVELSVNVREIRASMLFEYRIPAVKFTCRDETFAAVTDCSVPVSGGSLFVQLNPVIEGVNVFSSFLQNGKLPLSSRLSYPFSSVATRLEIFVPARRDSSSNGDLLCVSALGVGNILCFTFFYKIPSTPLAAHFDSFGSSIILRFASETQMPVDCELIFTPSTLILLGGKNAVCMWTSSTLLRVILSTESVVAPGDRLHVFVANSATSFTSSIEVQPPLNPVALDVDIFGPGNMSVCDTLEIEAVVSSSRSVKYSWSCLPPCPNDFDSRLRSLTGPKFVTSASLLPTKVPLKVLVTVSTFLGALSSSEPLLIYVHPSPLPSVSISPSAKKLQRQDFLELSAICAFSSCTAEYERMTFAWSVETRAPLSESVVRLIQTAKQSVLLLQPYSLISGYDYDFSVSIRQNSMENSAVVTITVLQGQLVALIDGGSRTLSNRDLLVLDGSRSIDSDANRGSSERLQYCWTCQWKRGNDLESCKYTVGALFGTFFPLPCIPIVNVALQNITSTLTEKFVFSLIVRSFDGRVSSDSVTLSLPADTGPSLDVYVRSSCVADVCRDSDSIVLSANLSLSFTYKWTLVHSPKLATTLSFDGSNNLLRFQPLALPPGNYEFSCVITDAKQISGQSAIKFRVVSSPKGGRCQNSVPVAPSTASIVSCAGWSTLFPPIRLSLFF
jgi:hypothetical protein